MFKRKKEVYTENLPLPGRKETDFNKKNKEQDRCGLSRRGFIASLVAGVAAVASAACRPMATKPKKTQSIHKEWHRVYNPEARREVDPTQIIIQVLSSTDRFLKYVADTRAGILDDFGTSVITKLDNYLQGYRSDMRDLNFGQICEILPFSRAFPAIFELSLHLVSKQLKIPQDHSFASPKVEVRTVDSLGALSVPRYHRIKAIVEVLGRDVGIHFFKDFVEHIFRQPPEKRYNRSFKEFKQMLIDSWSRSESFEFVIAHFDDHMFVGKFNKCMRYEVLKYLDDPEISFLAQCYEGPANVARISKKFRMRRQVTLFNHHFCDEFFWDSEVHGENPAQPSLEFLESLDKE
jgi:hypothetical protein